MIEIRVSVVNSSFTNVVEEKEVARGTSVRDGLHLRAPSALRSSEINYCRVSKYGPGVTRLKPSFGTLSSSNLMVTKMDET